MLSGADLGDLLVLGVAAVVLGLLSVRRPVVAVIAMLLALFLHVALAPYSRTPPFWFALALLLGAVFWWWLDHHRDRPRSIGAIGWAMGLYLGWIVYSMVSPHELSAAVGNPSYTRMAVPGFVVSSTVIPFVLFLVGRLVVNRASALRAVLWALLLMAGYSALLAVMQFHGLERWMWPRLNTDPSATWIGRANGVTGQPVENGIVLALGIAIAMQVISRGDEPGWRRCSAAVIAVGCGYGIYLTHTRAAWLSGAIVLVIGASLAVGYRRWFVVTLGAVTAIIATHWSTFTSANRTAGGIGSESEVDDRLNMIRTALWAAERKPLAGWGISRFQAVNTYHHQQWSSEVPWFRGYGIVSHENELGILAELGLIGLGLWVLVVALIAHRLWTAYRRLPDSRVTGSPLALTALIALAVFIVSGFTVDLRFLSFGTSAVFLLAGLAIGWSDRYRGRATPELDQKVLVRSE